MIENQLAGVICEMKAGSQRASYSAIDDK